MCCGIKVYIKSYPAKGSSFFVLSGKLIGTYLRGKLLRISKPFDKKRGFFIESPT